MSGQAEFYSFQTFSCAENNLDKNFLPMGPLRVNLNAAVSVWYVKASPAARAAK